MRFLHLCSLHTIATKRPKTSAKLIDSFAFCTNHQHTLSERALLQFQSQWTNCVGRMLERIRHSHNITR